MTTMNGVVKAVKRDRTSIQMEDGNWYGAKFNKVPEDVNAGDTVRFDYTQKGDWLNVKGSIVKVEGASKDTGAPKNGGGTARTSNSSFVVKEFPVGPLHPDRSIIRQNSLTHATRVWEATIASEVTGLSPRELEAEVDIIIAVARKFEAYSTGDLDMQQADMELKSMNPKVVL